MDTESKKEDKNNKVLPYYFFKLVMKSVIREILSYVIIIAIVLFIKYFIASPINVVGKSMVPTLHDRDLMLLDEISYRFSDIKRFDIVVARTKEGFIIKRVIGLPGEKIYAKDGVVYINGKKLKEDFKHSLTEDFKEVKIGNNSYYLLGDNRINSMDSRVYGTFSKKKIRGKTHIVLYPFSRFGSIK